MPTDTPRAARRALILALLCGVGFMVTLDLAIVNVALPTLQRDLGVEQDDLQWVVITYGLTLGGFLLLGGRAADLLGRRKVLVAGLALFTAASLAAGLSGSLGLLVAARAVQGLGAALAAPAALSTLTGTFAEGPERTRALGIFGAVGGSAAAIGVMLGGALTLASGLGVDVPRQRAGGRGAHHRRPADGPRRPPSSRRPGRRAGGRAGDQRVDGGRLRHQQERRQRLDLVDHRRLRGRRAGVAGPVRGGRAPRPVAAAAARHAAAPHAHVVARGGHPGLPSFLATIFQASLFMQQVLGYSAMRTGLAYLAIAGTAVVVAAGVAAPVVGRLGAGSALALGQAAMAAGLLWLARVPVDADYWTDLFPGFLLVGVGIGFSGMAAQVAAFIGVEQPVAGLAGGLVETAREVGGALGTAVVATVAVGRAGDVLAAEGGEASAVPVALTEGFQRGSLVAAGLALVAALAAATLLRPAERRTSRLTAERRPSDFTPEHAGSPPA